MTTRVQFDVPARGILTLLFLSLFLCACSTGSENITLNPDKSIHEVIDAATGPLEDLNIKQREIPPLLKEVAKDPYAPPKQIKCAAIRDEIGQLDVLLGPDIKPEEVQYAANESILSDISDIQNVEIPDTATVADRGFDFLHDKVLSLVQGHTNILPFRSIIRTVTGANRHQKKVENAYQAGKLRRAYLKGLAQSKFGRSCLAKPILDHPPTEAPPPSYDVTL